MSLTSLDVLLILLVGAGAVFGFVRGFVAELLSLFAWILVIVALRYFHAPLAGFLQGPLGSGAWLLALVILFALVFGLGKLAAHRVGGRVRRSVVGPVDRVLGAGFGALKGLIAVTLHYLALNFVYDMWWGRAAARPEWMSNSRSWPLLHASGEAIVDLVETRRGPEPEADEGTSAQAPNSQAGP